MSEIQQLHHYIDGRFCAGVDHHAVHNPASAALLAYAPQGSAQEVGQAIAAARAAHADWAARPAIERAGFLRRIAALIRRQSRELAHTITAEQGKTQALSEIEVRFTADYLDYMAEWARRIEGEIISSDRVGEQIFLLRKPLGVVAGILPWNFPFFLIARKMAPALLMGNTILIKPSEETPINCYRFSQLVDEAGLPAGVFNVIYGQGQTGAEMAGSGKVDMVSFTGSVSTGASIAAAAAPHITKLNLELGGKAPAIVLADADLDLAVKAIRDSRIINSGQVCNCVERVYVEARVADAFIDKIANAMAATRYGDPLLVADLDMGPLINRRALDRVQAKVAQALEDGAQLITGGQVADLGAGCYFQPTVLAACHGQMDIMRQEIFGPVLPIQVVDSLEQAIHLANDCEYGLTSSIYTHDLAQAMQAMRALDFGETYINRENFEAMQGYHAGVRKSGIGGADGKHGLYEYSHTQVVYLQAG